MFISTVNKSTENALLPRLRAPQKGARTQPRRQNRLFGAEAPADGIQDAIGSACDALVPARLAG